METYEKWKHTYDHAKKWNVIKMTTEYAVECYYLKVRVYQNTF